MHTKVFVLHSSHSVENLQTTLNTWHKEHNTYHQDGQVGASHLSKCIHSTSAARYYFTITYGCDFDDKKDT